MSNPFLDPAGQPGAIFERSRLAMMSELRASFAVPPMAMTTTREQPVGPSQRALPDEVPGAWLELPHPQVDDLLQAIAAWVDVEHDPDRKGPRQPEREERLLALARQLGALKPELHRLVAEAERGEG